MTDSQEGCRVICLLFQSSPTNTDSMEFKSDLLGL